ncbi:MAG: nucleotide exchange factor GrpE [Proteobacteria bacterium]|nr:nucleotide exchange factor GrpE [Pseudomonadota bacterium]MBU1582147.1 nucleotide exchange factor GrpE [Pseudomonadota bacterium]MBU2456223.1 nucleotide exchange factor GrpE [Pseudomonadota bacterium]MBU2628644.1 nucleotide exchange factor GrpE [Pseudomonadota bacterium]
MADELQEKAYTVTGGQRSQADDNSNKETSGQRQGGEQKSDMTSVWKDRYIRLLADLENTKKRLSRDSAQEVERQKEKLLSDVLLVADGLDLALLHLSSENDSRNIFQGIELLRDILDKFFIKYDVKIIAAWGEVFDPNLHEAIGMVQHPAADPNTVVRVERKGYLYRGKLLRPAQVLVAAS